jgi:quercetin dioxygenase-like cupin family protein
MMPANQERKRRTIARPSGGAITILVSAEETGGAMSMIETLSPPGSGPTYHSHSREDEPFYFVSGTAEIRLENQVFECEAGEHVFGPRRAGESDMGKLFLCATVLTGTAAAGTLVLLAGAAAAGGAAVVCCCRSRQRTQWV